MVVVGTGIAINATGEPHASWLGLLKHGIRHLVQERFQPQWGIKLEASLDAAFSPFQLQNALQHAELVEQALSTPNETAFAHWLETVFCRFKCRAAATSKAPLEAVRDLHEAGAIVMTTNYDSLLSEVTGLPPVTWEEHADFHRVMTRQNAGILHIHGHWQRPSSIVLGRTSYERVVADQDLQQLFRTLWLDWTWIYIGCGDGLDDPNLGRLLEWGKRWGESALPDFFLAQEAKAKEIARRPNRPSNLVSVGYSTHTELPEVLRSITPAARCWPFIQVDGEFPLFRLPGSNIPFPSWQEYFDGDVPTLAADAELEQRLQTHGWACMMDVASVGKTTLALRSATTHEQRQHPVFYFDLKDEILEDEDASPAVAVQRISRTGTLLILDNIHHKPELARLLWQQWSSKSADSRGRLLLVATRIHQVGITPDQDLRFFESHSINPAIHLQVTPEDLGRVAKYIYRRVGGEKCPPMPDPPAEALAEWHHYYRAALSAFTFATMDSLADFQRGEWSLPLSRASEWVRERWLKRLNAPELENAICLAAFGAQELEMMVQVDALPHPGRLTQLVKLGLLMQKSVGRLGQYRQFSLREPEWGHLILAAVDDPVDIEKVLSDASAQHPIMAVTLSIRLKREGLMSRHERLWKALAKDRARFGSKWADVPLDWVAKLLRQAKEANQIDLTLSLWQAIESQINKFTKAAWATSLDKLGSFLAVAKAHGRDTAPLWDAIESQPDKLVASMWNMPLQAIASFVKTAQLDGRNSESFWQMLANEPEHLSRKGLTSNLEEMVGFAHYAPNSLLEIALLKIRPGRWDATPSSEGLVGATWLAWECSNVQRDDLALDLITLLFRRANWRDVPSQRGGFGQACWLLANVPSSLTNIVPSFMKAVCTEKWLQIAYATAHCGQLASGLRQLALHQTVEICCQLQHKGLGLRLNKELARFETVAPKDRSEVIQFLGCAVLCGWAVNQRSFASINHESISQLPLETLPHQPGVAKIEDHQLQLWLGLRAFVSITHKSQFLPRSTIEETLNLWRANVGETALNPETNAHRLNQSMVKWLETCLLVEPSALIPSKERLWILAGFPFNLDLPTSARTGPEAARSDLLS